MPSKERSIVAYNVGIVVRVLVFSRAYALIGAIFPLQGEPTTGYVLGSLVTGFSYALLLASILTRMPIGRRGRIFSIWVAVYAIQLFNPLIEGYFFTDQFEDATLFIGGALFGMILALLYALVAGFLFVPESATISLAGQFKDYFSQRKAYDWSLRIVLSALSWPLFYYVFGSLVAPVVWPYYTDPSLGYMLRLPRIEIIISIQTLRGFVYVGSLLPIIACLKIKTRRLFLFITGLLYIGGALAMFIIVESFPVVLRIAHGFGDLLFASVSFGIVISYLLRAPREVG